MKFYFAPMEGITGYIYRNAHHTIFNNVDKYFTPFLVPNKNKGFSFKEKQDILPEHNQGITVIPQILTNHAEAFISTAVGLKELGYHEVNLNLGCPSGTVVSKNKGSGFLALREELDLFLKQIFSIPDMKISIKTRIGKDSPDEFYELIKIFNQYPLEELIIHPRIQTDFYKNKPNLKVFRDAFSLSDNPVCYNGDIFSLHDYEVFSDSFSTVQTTMLGRGMVTNPGLANELENRTFPDKKQIKKFHDIVYQGYQKTMSGDRNVLFRMKEIWHYMNAIFSNPANYSKKIKKAEKISDYEAAVTSLFSEQTLINEA